MERFQGKAALVTGATRGIGAAIARRLASEGAQVCICGRSEADGQALVAQLGGAGRALFVRADLSKPADCAAAVDATIAAFGRLDVLVNNAASVARGTIENTTVEDFDQMMALNLRAPFLLIQRAMPAFKAQLEQTASGGAACKTSTIRPYIGL